jgi:hypothetical protein
MGAAIPSLQAGLFNQSSAQMVDGSLKFDSGSSNYLTRTPASAGNRKVWTLSYWIRLDGDAGHLFSANNDAFQFEYRSTGQLLFANSGSTSGNTLSTALFRDHSAFYHVVIQHDAVNLAANVYINGTLNFTATLSNADGTWNNNTSHNINGRSTSNDSYGSFAMSQVYFIDGLALGPGYFGFTDPLTNTWRPKKFRAEGTTVNDGTQWSSYMSNTSTAGNLFDGSTSSTYGPDGNPQTFTPPNPIIVRNSLRIYYSSGVASRDFEVNDNGNVISTGTGTFWVDLNFTGSLTKLYGTNGWNVRAIEVDGVIMKDSTTTNLAFGTNGFYLPMDNDDFHIDKSGNGNNWTKQNFSGTSIDPDVLKDSPSGAVSGGRAQTGITTTSSAPANYCTLNPIDAFVSTKDGNLETATSSGWQSIRATLGMKSGKFYWETQNNQDAAAILGIADTQATGFVDGAIFGSTGHGGGDANPAWTWAGANYYFNATTAGTGLSNHVSSDVVQYAFDADSGNLWFGRNGTWYNSSWATTGDPANGVNPTVSGIDTTKTYVACGSFYNGSAKFNFGQKPFKYAPPQGYLPLNSASGTPETVVPRPNQYMNTVTYTGTGSDLTLDVGFKPDLSYFSTRSATGYIKYIFDSVRGATKYLATSHTQGDDAEGTSSSTLKSFNANGVTIGNNAQMNENSSNTWVSWHWKAGGNKNTFNVDDVGYASAAAAGLDGGNKTPTGASVGTKQGFSIVKFTNDTTSPITLSHGLTQAPTFVILKALTGSVGWTVGHTSIGFTKRLKLNGTDAESASANFFNDTAPTSSLITLGANNVSNDFIMYSWHDVPGLQKFGSYSSNNSTDGPFIELGFRPALILIKESGASGQSWNICDTSRNSSNPANKVIALNSNAAEYSYTTFDILSNGFKIRTNDNGWNGSSSTFIYAAWAEAPVSNLYGGQSNAR